MQIIHNRPWELFIPPHGGHKNDIKCAFLLTQTVYMYNYYCIAPASGINSLKTAPERLFRKYRVIPSQSFQFCQRCAQTNLNLTNVAHMVNRLSILGVGAINLVGAIIRIALYLHWITWYERTLNVACSLHLYICRATFIWRLCTSKYTKYMYQSNRSSKHLYRCKVLDPWYTQR